MFKIIILESLDILSTFYAIKYQIQKKDKMILSCIFSLILHNSQMPFMILFSKYFLIDWSIVLYILPHINLKFQIYLLLKNLDTLKNLIYSLILLIVILILIYKVSIFDKIQKTNIMRKSFHIFLLSIYFYPSNFLINLSEIIFIILIIISCTDFLNKYLSILKSKRDTNRKFITSHIFLIVSCSILYKYVNLNVFRLNLISVCVLDAMASITGIFLKKNAKSFEGSLVGIISGIIFCLLFEKKSMIFYFSLVGLVEYFDFYNDNIAIPVFSFLYFKFQKYLKFHDVNI